MRVFIGLDVSLAKTAVCVVDRDGAVQWQGGSKRARSAHQAAGGVVRDHRACRDRGLSAVGVAPSGAARGGIPVTCIETRHAERFLSSRPVKTDKNDARGIAEMMRLGHYRPVHVKSPAAQSMRTTLAARMQLVASQLQIEGTIRGLLKVYGLKIGSIHRNRFAARVLDLLEMAALPELSAAIEPLLRVREGMRAERKAFDRTCHIVSSG
jgi:transposase